MIDPALLDRLREADPDTWKRFDETELFTYREYDDYGSIECYAYQEDVIEAVRAAWLQHVLQEAIASREWAYQIMHTPRHIKATVLKKCIYTIFGEGKTDTEALLRAYLGAIKE